MYVAYGWPKLLCIATATPQPIVHLSVKENRLLLVTASYIQVWNATQHKVKLGQWGRDKSSVLQEGENVAALWSADTNNVAVLTSGSYLHFYHVRTSEKQLRLSGQDDPGLSLVNVIFSSTIDASLLNRSVTVSCIAADHLNIVLGLSNCCLRLVSWNGELLGVLDVLQGFVSIHEASYLREANTTPSSPSSLPHQSPSFLPLLDGISRRRRTSGFSQLEISATLHLLVALLSDGTVVLCSFSEKGLRQASDITPEKWVGVFDAVCASIAEEQQVLAVGTRRGTVEMFNLADSASLLRTISLFDWGAAHLVALRTRFPNGSSSSLLVLLAIFQRHSQSVAQLCYWALLVKGQLPLAHLASRCWLPGPALCHYAVEDTGPVIQIRWTQDNCALAVGWRNRGLAVWSASGCRLMCTIRQGSMSNSSLSPHTGSDISRSEPMVEGVAALAWGQKSYQLYAVEQGSATQLVEFPFAKSCASRTIAGVTNAWQIMHGADRVLLVQSDLDNDIKVHYLVLPQSYVGENWPISHVAANEDGTFLAIAGRRGLILHDLQLKKWRVFGDVSQERKVHCAGVVWLGKIVVLCNYLQETNCYELCLYPRYHLDETSLLCRKQLPGKPIAMDVWQDYLLVTCPPFDIYVFKVHLEGDLSPLKAAAAQLFTVRELSIMSARKAPAAMLFVPNSGAWSDANTPASESPCFGFRNEPWREVTDDAASKQPTRCMILRTDGELSLLDLDHGNERRLVSGIERFWLSCGRVKEEADLIQEVSWWAYGDRGMQVWYPSSTADTSQVQDLCQLDPELDFDREVYPLGLFAAAGIIVGISQRLSLSGCATLPCFEPTPQAQPILPCLLWHLLQRNKLEEAVRLASLSEGTPHFSHSLEWLLFTVFDAAMSSQYDNKRRGKVGAAKRIRSHLLQQVCTLIQNFAEYLDVLVSVARKTDSRHWPDLFSVAGKSTKLFEECFEKGLYRTATCYILVIEKLEGSALSQHSAIRLLKATLEVSMYELAGELVLFLLRCGREGEFTETEADRHSNSLFSSLFTGLTSSTPLAEADQNHATVKRILEDHGIFLMERKELRELVSFVKGTHFDLRAFLLTERGKSARLKDFVSALQLIGHKDILQNSVREGPADRLRVNEVQGRLDAEYLLAHMVTVGFREWIVVLATLLNRPQVLLEVFRGDLRLWQAYSTTLKSQENYGDFQDLLVVLDGEMLVYQSDSNKLQV